IQRMEADDLMAAVFPTLAACQENVAPGPMEIPDQPLVRQTLTDCLHEAMDVDGLREVVAGVESGEIRVVVRDTTEPSVLAHEILNGAPYTFLDDAPLEERRSRAVPVRRGLPVQPDDLARLDADAVRRVRDEVRPEPRDPDELHDLLMTVVASRPEAEWRPWLLELVERRRAVTVTTESGPLWAAVERRPTVELLYPGAALTPDHHAPRAATTVAWPDREAAVAEMLRGHLDHLGPVTVAARAETTGLPEGDVAAAAVRLEVEGFAFRGRFTEADGPEEFCARRLLARIHGYTRQRLRAEIAPVTTRDYLRFLLRWQHAEPGTQREGRLGVLSVVAQMQGYELAAGSWEDVLRARVQSYRPEWLDDLCAAGDVAWGRLSPRELPLAGENPSRAQVTPSRATPITLTVRDDLPWLLQAAREGRLPPEPEPGRTAEVVTALTEHGALFAAQLAAVTGLPAAQVDEALWEAVARGLVTADAFRALRHLLDGRRSPVTTTAHRLRRGN
ncbi:MAG: Lhr family ATP-dependent helicase, partial [Thermocrispum sp.]